MTEVWKEVLGTEGAYDVSNFGRVRSYCVRKPLGMGKGSKNIINRNAKPRDLVLYKAKKGTMGYFVCDLKIYGKRKKIHVHALVLKTFKPNEYFNGAEAAHLDGKSLNNHIDNLKWCTRKENHGHKKIHGTLIYGSKHKSSKLTEEDIKEIRTVLRLGIITQKVLAEKYKVSQTLISHILLRKIWKRVY